jgi:hypothetical protein
LKWAVPLRIGLKVRRNETHNIG